MATNIYNLRTRVNGSSSVRTTPTASPTTLKPAPRSPRKAHHSPVALQLQHVIGTTTTTPTGLTCCPATNQYAYCAGAVAVLATVQTDGTTSKKYYRARPTAPSLNAPTSYYDKGSPSTTPSRRRTSLFSPTRARDPDATPVAAREWEDGASQTWTARERIKTVTCVAISSTGRWLAVGESGYNPRVLLYSTTEDAATDVPISIVAEHAIGIKSVAFSPDSKYLATLGNLNDGFLYVWSINARTGQLTLVAANKCTTNIGAMTWCGQTLITVGTRHVKAWTVSEAARSSPSKRFSLQARGAAISGSGPATLHGRNALLGSLVDCTFTSVISIDDQRTAIVTSDAGHLCMFHTDGSPELQILKAFESGISSIAWQPARGKLILGGRQGLTYEDYDDLLAAFHSAVVVNGTSLKTMKKRLRSSAVRMSMGLLNGDHVGISAVGCLSEHTIALDTDGNLQMESTIEESSRPDIAFASHNDLIQGVQGLPTDCQLGAFYTWSRRGELKFWDTSGTMLCSRQMDLDQADLEEDNNPNELRVARFHSETKQVLLGDRLGILKLLDLSTSQAVWTARAHGAEVTDIAIHERQSLVSTCSRDRMVQVFAFDTRELELLQTLDDHIGAVTHLLFSEDGGRLLSSSTDRTIVVRERVQREVNGRQMMAFLSMRIVTLRSSPMSMTFADDVSGMLIVSTNDRHIAKVDPSAGTIIENNKVTDPENDDTVALCSISISHRGTAVEEVSNLLVACSPTDKSVRIYDADKCLLLTRESGHTEGISDLCLIEDRDEESGEVNRTLVSTGLDGTIMIWTIRPTPPPTATPMHELSQSVLLDGWESDSTPSKPSPATLPPLRKVLSKVEVLEFSRSAGPSTPSSPRSLSPPRLTRKRSQLALSSTIDEKDEEEPLPSRRTSDGNVIGRGREPVERSSSPEPPTTSAKPKKQRSKSVVGASTDAKRALANRSPSPPPGWGSPNPSTPRNRALANNGRLRRPPSVPTDLRERALAQRKQSTGPVNDFGSMGMATEQATRMLKTYRQKLTAAKEDLGLDELESELERLMKLVKEKKATNVPGPSRTSRGTLRRMKSKPVVAASDLDGLAVLMDQTNLAERSPKGLKT
ncbi:uncharacterized protein HMPREF1541_03889 [Cyphellophora europaea CBS 101466]|uniref:Uncharacterized protein n=1 Tax=Cyphellophora europaea (strain CBS 101466) TaxID=1220924 RepID=W2S034_CYPE1|nr:uncharacterized protein HMPREF1541_03889 [Cyphellophora europaea CBS 101466]ETN41950.1 hypothetical protein HMPREF1541_03889 [Cyphellophora europaea CBS 101466]